MEEKSKVQIIVDAACEAEEKLREVLSILEEAEDETGYKFDRLIKQELEDGYASNTLMSLIQDISNKEDDVIEDIKEQIGEEENENEE